MNGLPSAPISVSRAGSKQSRPARASAVTISGLATKLWVPARPSLRPGKLRLKEVTIVLGARPRRACGATVRCRARRRGPHCAPIARSDPSWPSRSSVARICSEPGVPNSFARARRPWARACSPRAQRGSCPDRTISCSCRSARRRSRPPARSARRAPRRELRERRPRSAVRPATCGSTPRVELDHAVEVLVRRASTSGSDRAGL